MAQPQDNCKLWIGDLPADVTKEKITEIFGAYGTVTDVFVLANSVKNGKGAALVRFGNPQEAQWITDNLNGNMPQGLTEPIICKFASQGGGKGGGSGDGGSGKGGGDGGWGKGGGDGGWGKGGGGDVGWGKGGGGKGGGGKGGGGKGGGGDGGAVAADKLWIGDLPADITKERLAEIFGAYGNVVDVFVLANSVKNGKGAALIRFGNPQEAQWIIDNLNGNMPQGLTEPIICKFASQGGGKGGGSGDGGWGKGGSGGDGGWGKGGGGDGGWGKDGGGKGKWGPYSGGKGEGCDIKTLLKAAAKGGYIPGVGVKPANECQVYIKGLPTDTTDLDLYKMMSPFGAICEHGVKAMVDAQGQCTTIGFVDFLGPTVAQQVIQTFNGFTMPDGSSLFLKTKNPGGKGKGGEGKGQEQAWGQE